MHPSTLCLRLYLLCIAEILSYSSLFLCHQMFHSAAKLSVQFPNFTELKRASVHWCRNRTLVNFIVQKMHIITSNLIFSSLDGCCGSRLLSGRLAVRARVPSSLYNRQQSRQCIKCRASIGAGRGHKVHDRQGMQPPERDPEELTPPHTHTHIHVHTLWGVNNPLLQCGP